MEELSSTELGKTRPFAVKIFLKLFSPEATDFEVCTVWIPRDFGKILYVCPSISFSRQIYIYIFRFLVTWLLLAGFSANVVSEAHKTNSKSSIFPLLTEILQFCCRCFPAILCISTFCLYCRAPFPSVFNEWRAGGKREGKGKEKDKGIAEGKTFAIPNRH